MATTPTVPLSPSAPMAGGGAPSGETPVVHLIPIAAIEPWSGKWKRIVRPEHLAVLAESIAEIGLQTPITVTPIPGGRYQLHTGEHRRQACLALGWTEIPAIFPTLNDIDREIWHLDENLCRAELTVLERCEHLADRKSLYELKHPQTKHGGNRGNQHAGGKKRQVANSASCRKSFVEDTAAKTGMSERTIQQSVHRAEAIAPEVQETIAAMPAIADKGVELDALAQLPVADQAKAVAMVKTGECKTVREAAKRVNPEPPPAAPVDSARWPETEAVQLIWNALCELRRCPKEKAMDLIVDLARLFVFAIQFVPDGERYAALDDLVGFLRSSLPAAPPTGDAGAQRRQK